MAVTADSKPFDFQPVLKGDTITLRPLQPDDFDALYAAASDPLVWEQHPSPLRYQREVFEREYFSGALSSAASLVVVDNRSGRLVGCSRYYDWDEANREVAIGFTFLGRDVWGGAVNREKKTLMLNHAFQWADLVWFHIGKTNWRSRKAVEKIGALFSHEDNKAINGVNHEYAFYTLKANR